MSTRRTAELQTILEGVPLPAGKRELIDYARRQDEDAALLLESLSDREYRSVDDVGEALAPVQPARARPDAQLPRDESGEPPGGEAYLDPHARPGAVRPSNSPEKTLQEQTQTQKKQQKRQQQLG